MIKQIGLPLRGRPVLLITRMITDRIGLPSVLLPLLIFICCMAGPGYMDTKGTCLKEESPLSVLLLFIIIIQKRHRIHIFNI